MFLLLIPYQLFIAGRAPGTGISAARLMKISILGVLLAGMTYFVATAFFAHRLHDISEGSDPSFFYRVEGPILAAQEVLSRYPIAGAGLTGEPFIEDVVVNAYIRSPAFSRGWHIASPATELLINYFWLHWIYLGLVWGTFAILRRQRLAAQHGGAASGVLLDRLGDPGPGVGCLCRADDLGDPVPGGRRGATLRTGGGGRSARGARLFRPPAGGDVARTAAADRAMMRMPFSRRSVLTMTGGMALGATLAADVSAGTHPAASELSAAGFGIVGDGQADDTAALQSALDAAVAQDGALLTIPPGNYRITAPLRMTARTSLARPWGIRAHGARFVSAIADGGHVLHIRSAATARFLMVEGLSILGTGREGSGLVLECDDRNAYLYNGCLRDITVEHCGGDGLTMVGNVFESQIFNCYLRDNRGNGATFAHGQRGGILSAIHVFGCVFGQNSEYGAALEHGCYDVAFNGCYFLLNGRFGLAAGNGCTLLNGCGFENNHMAAAAAESGNAAIRLIGFGTVLACGSYSVMKQLALIDATVTEELVMIGCRGFGDGSAKAAGLGRFSGTDGGLATLIGCQGAVERLNGFDPIEMAGTGGGLRLGADWHSRSLVQLGEYRMWVDRGGHLRLKKGSPEFDEDGAVVGS